MSVNFLLIYNIILANAYLTQGNSELDHAASVYNSERWKFWDYSNGVGGPMSWGYYYPHCELGRYQSPINIQSEHLVYDFQLSSISIETSSKIYGILHNDERNLFITLTNGFNVNISGGPLQYHYQPIEIYIRLGPTTIDDGIGRGSEHKINNRSFHGEV